ncbi:pilus assembly protein [Devosia sp. YIM 151766]|uniref:TadE/TadG family type IV pilus assembly protein n=1 Tax=Devosia sp. YIM 151766 TaxID=3017325 RepID=UPI00255CE7BE|nr:TadE/TadG family type IV pilus assembly protein [Devosia sp. YIM 151766]WIY53319.1 pilus assembly protein [Devosia sp. YIM 151766]
MSKNFARFAGLFRRQRRGILRDEQGATAVEFALLAFPFFLILAGILQTSVIFLASQVLESAVHDASRAIRTGQVQQSGDSLEDFRSQVCDRLFGLFPDCSGLHMRVVEVINFQSATISVPVETTCSGDCDWTILEAWSPGDGKSIVLVQVYYRYPVALQFGPLGMANLPNGSRLLGTATVFQNEPFT